jgi:hypothetical protein
MYFISTCTLLYSLMSSDHSPPYVAEVKNAWSYTFTLSIRLRGVVLS